jgi:hypothetical protein
MSSLAYALPNPLMPKNRAYRGGFRSDNNLLECMTEIADLDLVPDA